MSRTAAIVQARIGSQRLPAKVLLPLPTGRLVIEEVLHRVLQVKGVDDFILAIPNTPENDILVDYADPKFLICRGPEDDVLSRFVVASELTTANVFLRITSDCPLLDPSVCSDLLRLRSLTNCGYISNAWPRRSYPIGHDCEAFTRETLWRAHIGAREPYDREHVCPYMQRDEKSKTQLMKEKVDRSNFKWTLDTLDDYIRIFRVMNTMCIAATEKRLEPV